MNIGSKSSLLIACLRENTRGEDVIFHGTRALDTILRENCLRCSEHGEMAVSFTRCLNTAVYWSLLSRGDTAEVPGILVIDRHKLRSRYKLEPFHDTIWDGDGNMVDEMEERVPFRDVHDVTKLLFGVLSAVNGKFVGRQHAQQLREAWLQHGRKDNDYIVGESAPVVASSFG